MQISDTELRKVVTGGLRMTDPIELDEPSPRESDKSLIQALTREIIEMPDREDRVSELKARIEAGEYNPSGHEIADAMVRRTIADRMK